MKLSALLLTFVIGLGLTATAEARSGQKVPKVSHPKVLHKAPKLKKAKPAKYRKAKAPRKARTARPSRARKARRPASI